jgi:hypothetical protein
MIVAVASGAVDFTLAFSAELPRAALYFLFIIHRSYPLIRLQTRRKV